MDRDVADGRCVIIFPERKAERYGVTSRMDETRSKMERRGRHATAFFGTHPPVPLCETG